MTGGSLPAHDLARRSWPMPTRASSSNRSRALAPAPTPAARNQVAAARRAAAAPPPRPTVLTRRGADVLVRIEHMMEDASRALPRRAATCPSCRRPGDAAARPRPSPSADRRFGSRRCAWQLDVTSRPTMDALRDCARHRSSNGSIVRLLLGSLFAFAIAAARRTWHDLADAGARHRVRRRCDRRLDRLAEDRHAATSIPMRGRRSPAPASCRSAPATASPSSPAPTMTGGRSTAAATS